MSTDGDSAPLLVAPYKSGGYALFEWVGQGTLKRTDFPDIPDQYRELVVEFPLVDASNSSGAHPPVATSKLPDHLRNLVIIDSSYSGTQKSSSVYFGILQPLLKALGIPHVYVSTTSVSTIENHAKSFSSSSTVVFLSGDTSVHEFINSLSPVRDPVHLTVSIIPTGTGNALSTSIGHSGLPHSISRLFIGTPHPLTAFEIEFPNGTTLDGANALPIHSLRSLVVSSWAFHAALVADSDSPEYRKHGIKRFGMAAEANLARDQKYHGKIEYNSGGHSHTVSGPHSYVMFTLASKLEPTFTISPLSSPPGQLDVYMVEFGHLDGGSIMDLMKLAYANGSHVNDSRVLYKKLEPANGIIATTEVNESDPLLRRWCVDGRILNVANGKVVLHRPSTSYNGWDLRIVK